MLTLGYFVADYFFLFFLSQDYSNLGIQSMVHHMMAIICLLCMLYGGMELPLATQIVMGTEITNVILIIRDRLGKNSTSLAANINSACLVIFYTVLRVVMMPIVWVQMLKRLLNPGSERPLPYVISLVTFGLIIGLNLYWYSFIVVGVRNLIVGDKPPGVDIEFEKEEGRRHQDDEEYEQPKDNDDDYVRATE